MLLRRSDPGTYCTGSDVAGLESGTAEERDAAWLWKKPEGVCTDQEDDSVVVAAESGVSKADRERAQNGGRVVGTSAAALVTVVVFVPAKHSEYQMWTQ
jgi:hypothetical protein